MAVDEADMANQRHPLITKQPHRLIGLEVGAAGRDPFYERVRDRPFPRQHVLVVERCLIATHRVLVAAWW